MNKSESKYFNTALRMDEALLALLEEKDLEYITVKEICHRAGVNRSTFYLHYETIADLVDETLEMINQRFRSYFPQQEEEVLGNMGSRERENLVLVTREYLLPYLRFIRDNKKVYRAAFRNPSSMQAHTRYGELKQQILGPILERFEIPAAHRAYYMAYYVEGIIAIVKEWLRQDCTDEVEMIADIIESCVRPRDGSRAEQLDRLGAPDFRRLQCRDLCGDHSYYRGDAAKGLAANESTANIKPPILCCSLNETQHGRLVFSGGSPAAAAPKIPRPGSRPSGCGGTERTPAGWCAATSSGICPR